MYTVPSSPLTGTTGTFVDLEGPGGATIYQWQIEGTFDSATAQLEIDDASGSGGVAVSGVTGIDGTGDLSGIVTIPCGRQVRLTASGGGASQSLTLYLYPLR
jgi:hypothetical protein